MISPVSVNGSSSGQMSLPAFSERSLETIQHYAYSIAAVVFNPMTCVDVRYNDSLLRSTRKTHTHTTHTNTHTNTHIINTHTLSRAHEHTNARAHEHTSTHTSTQSTHEHALLSLDKSTTSSERQRAATDAWLKELERICSMFGIVLVFDEVYGGFRLGPRLSYHYLTSGVQPDVVVLG